MKVIVLFKPGFEEIEALSPVDVFRRANIPCSMVGMDSIEVTSSHGITIKMDEVFSEACYDADMVVLPGGMPGAANLRDDDRVIDILKDFNEKGKWIGAICAGPISLQKAGVIKGKVFTCSPGFETQIEDGIYQEALVQKDGNIITAKGPLAAFPFAYTLTEALGVDPSSFKQGMQYNYMKEHTEEL